MSIPFTYTNDSITVIHQGKPHVVPKGSPQFVNLRQALLDERWADVPNHLTVSKSLTTWAKGKVTVDENLEKFFFEVVRGKDLTWVDEYRFRCADGSYKGVYDRGYVIRDADGTATRMIGAVNGGVTLHARAAIDAYARRRTRSDERGVVDRARVSSAGVAALAQQRGLGHEHPLVQVCRRDLRRRGQHPSQEWSRTFWLTVSPV